MKKIITLMLMCTLLTGIFSAIPMNAASPDGTVLFSQNFDNVSDFASLGGTYLWECASFSNASIKEGRLLIENTTEFVDVSTAETYLLLYNMPTNIESFTYECDVTLVKADEGQFGGIVFHCSDRAGTYTNVILRKNGVFGISRHVLTEWIADGSNGANISDVEAHDTAELNVTYKFKIESTPDAVRFYIDGVDTSSVSPEVKNLSGAGGEVGVILSGGTTVAFDNIVVYSGVGTNPIYVVEEAPAIEEEPHTEETTAIAAQTSDNGIILIMLAAASFFAAAIIKKKIR